MTSVAKIEEHAVVAWPSTYAEQGGGWLLRHTPGVRKRRNNSALPCRPGVSVDAAEVFNRERDIPVTVQISPAEEHGELNAALAARGYRYDAPTLVMTAPVAAVADPDPAVTIEPELTVRGGRRAEWRAALPRPWPAPA